MKKMEWTNGFGEKMKGVKDVVGRRIKKPVPIRMLAGALVLLVIAAGFILYTSFSTILLLNPDEEREVSVDGIDTPLSLQDQITDLRKRHETAQLRIRYLEGTVQAQVDGTGGLPEKVNEFEAEIEALRQLVETYRADVEVLRQGFDELEQKKAAELAEKAEQKQAAAKKVRRPRPRLRKAPFDLVSIDSWGGEPSVVVRAGGSFHTLAENEGLRGWSVNSIDSANGVVTMRDSRGRKATMKLDR